MNPCGYTQETSARNCLKSRPKAVSRSKQREAGGATGFLGSEKRSKSQPK